MGAPMTDSERITQLQVRVEELEAAASRMNANMHLFREEHDRDHKALKKIDGQACERFRFTGNTTTCIERDDPPCRSCIAATALDHSNSSKPGDTTAKCATCGGRKEYTGVFSGVVHDCPDCTAKGEKT